MLTDERGSHRRLLTLRERENSVVKMGQLVGEKAREDGKPDLRCFWDGFTENLYLEVTESRVEGDRLRF